MQIGGGGPPFEGRSTPTSSISSTSNIAHRMSITGASVCHQTNYKVQASILEPMGSEWLSSRQSAKRRRLPCSILFADQAQVRCCDTEDTEALFRNISQYCDR